MKLKRIDFKLSVAMIPIEEDNLIQIMAPINSILIQCQIWPLYLLSVLYQMISSPTVKEWFPTEEVIMIIFYWSKTYLALRIVTQECSNQL